MTEDFKVSYQGWGGDSRPAEEPQAANDMDTSTGFQLYDTPGVEPGTGDYNFFFGNGQLEVSADHGHDELAQHAGAQVNQPGPFALGRIEVEQGRAHWLVTTNIALKGLVRRLKDYTKNAGWRWGGIASMDGNPISDDFMPKKAMFYTMVDGIASLSNRPSEGSTRIVLQGKTARVESEWVPEGVSNWLRDSGYKLAEYPGGGNMNDMIKNKQPEGGESLETYDMGAQSLKDMTAKPEDDGFYHFNGERFKTYEEYLAYKAALTRDLDQPVRGSGGFPEAPDMDKPLPNNFTDQNPYPDVTASWKVSQNPIRVNDLGLPSSWEPHGTGDYPIVYDPQTRTVHLGPHDGFHSQIEDALYDTQGISMYGLSQGRVNLDRNTVEWYTAEHPDFDDISSQLGWKRKDKDDLWNFSKVAAPQPKDMIEAPIPFIFDIDADKIVIGHPGTHTSDIPGEFTPGGIVEGEYAPGGKVTVSTATNQPWTVRHFADLFYWNFPQMEIKSISIVDADGKERRLANSDRVDLF